VKNPFPPPPLCRHCTSCRATIVETPRTAPSSAPTPRAPSTPLSVPSAAPMLHHRRSPLLGLHRHGTPCSGEPLPPRTPPPPNQSDTSPPNSSYCRCPPHHRAPWSSAPLYFSIQNLMENVDLFFYTKSHGKCPWVSGLCPRQSGLQVHNLH
jgi:hypothetical protein